MPETPVTDAAVSPKGKTTCSDSDDDQDIDKPLTEEEEKLLTRLMRRKLLQSSDELTVKCRTRGQPLELKKVTEPCKSAALTASPLRNRWFRGAKMVSYPTPAGSNAPAAKTRQTENMMCSVADFEPQYSTPNEDSFIYERPFPSDDYPMSYSLCTEFNIERRRKEVLNLGALSTIQKYELSISGEKCQSPSSNHCVATSLTATTTTTTTYKRPVVTALPGVNTVPDAFAKREHQREEQEVPTKRQKTVLAQDIIIDKPEASTRENIKTRSCQKDVCCVEGCSKQQAEEGSKKTTFFSFPREDARCKRWLQNCGQQELMGKTPFQLRSQGFKICSDHFDDSQFRYSAGPTSRRLISDAVPMLFNHRPGSKSPEAKKTQKKSSVSSGGQLLVKISSLLHLNSAGKGHRRMTAPQNAEQLPEIELEIDYAEEPPLHWMTSQSVAEVSPEGGGDGETATTVQPLTAAALIKVEPMDTHTYTVPVHTPLSHTDSEPLDINTEPLDINTEPLDISTEPLDINTEPLDISTEPLDINTEPQDIRAELLNTKSEPQDIRAELLNTKSEPLDICTEVLNINTEPRDIKAEPWDIRAELLNIQTEPLQISTELLNMKAEPLDIQIEPLDISTKLLNVKAERPLDITTEPQRHQDCAVKLEVGTLGEGPMCFVQAGPESINHMSENHRLSGFIN